MQDENSAVMYIKTSLMALGKDAVTVPKHDKPYKRKILVMRLLIVIFSFSDI
jgi:hypothetical protein